MEESSRSAWRPAGSLGWVTFARPSIFLLFHMLFHLASCLPSSRVSCRAQQLTPQNIHLGIMPVRACPGHSHKGFCNKHYSAMPSSCNYRLSFQMLIRNLILGSSSVGESQEKSCHMNASRSLSILLSWTSAMRLVRDGMIRNVTEKKDQIFMLEWYCSPPKSQTKPSSQSVRNT